jgi:predicted MFS family arabinose efflux permease
MRRIPTNSASDEPVIGRGLMLVMAIACGAMAANLYYAQPLIGLIGRDLGIASDRLGFIVMLTQFGYCAGLLVLVPLADRFENRRLILILTAGAGLGLTLVAFSQSMILFLAASMMVGICSVGAQVLVPLAAHLARPERQGRVIGSIMAGLLTGIMLARPLSSALTEFLGWRAAFLVPALFMLLLWLVLARVLPRRKPDGTDSPVQVIRSMVALFGEFPQLRRRSFYQACLFAAFNLFWTASPLMLHDRFGVTQGGLALFALAGAGGALAAPLAGRVADRGWTRAGSIGAMAIAAICFAATEPAVATLSIGMLVFLAIMIDASTQMNQVLGQNVIYRLAPQSRGRINAIYMSIIFVGGGMGSLVAPLLYDRMGWTGCAIGGSLLALVPLATKLLAARVESRAD